MDRKIVRTRLTTLAATSALLGSGLLWSASPAHATMPGTNGRIACASTRDGNSQIYTFDPAGTEVQATRITNNSAFDGRPRYSPDGRKIAFESNRDGPTEIYIMDAQVTAPGANAPTDGTNVRRLTFTGTPGHGNSSPTWSPGGDQIAFQSTRTGQFQVFKINIDGTGETQLTNEAAESTLPAWSPDGAKIAFSSRRDDPSADVYTMNPDGTGVVNLTHSPGEDSWPTWSP
ncbi:MAG: hypothetical protein M3066_20420, partial [Actinomycetota bacterium]|nr:hypothetical protein [Actinomycetota bacterium]